MRVIVVDFDGTITNGEAVELIPADVYSGDWRPYLAATASFLPREEVMDYILRQTAKIVILTARGGDRVAQVDEYLKAWGIRHLVHAIIGRSASEMHLDSGTFKGLVLDRWLDDGHTIEMVVDDHPGVINEAMVRGLKVWNPTTSSTSL